MKGKGPFHQRILRIRCGYGQSKKAVSPGVHSDARGLVNRMHEKRLSTPAKRKANVNGSKGQRLGFKVDYSKTV
jgi:hypothetical protein